jgi:uncharacterized protein (TIGR03083 family)
MTWTQQVETFAETAHVVGSMVAAIDDPTLPGLGEWDVHELAAHTLRALTTLESYLAQPAPTDEPPLADASAYFTAYLDVRRADPARTDAAVAERGRSAAAAQGLADIAARFGELATELIAPLQAAGPDRLVMSPWGAMRLTDYLRTRLFELVAHGLDLIAATGNTHRLPDTALRDALSLLVELAERRGLAPGLIRVLTGRHAGGVLPLVQ